MIKLTIDARLINASGIGVYIQNVLKSSFLQNFEVHLLINHSDRAFASKICKEAKLIEYNAKIYSIKELLLSPFKTLNTDIFWTPHYNIPVVSFASKLKIVTVHDVFHLAHINTLSQQQKIYAKTMIAKAIHSSDLVFTVSHFSKSEILKYVQCDADKIKVIYNGIDFNRFCNKFSTQQESLILNTYNISFNYILFVGNVKPHKNLKTALLAYKNYCCLYGAADLKFVVAGKKDGFITEDEDVTKLIEEPFFKENLHFTGWIADEHLPLLYQKAALFIFPSIYEGFGFPPLEAMAASCPVISSNTACMPEIYQNAAYYFNPLDLNDISEALFKVLTDISLKNDLIANGLLQAKKYIWERTLEKKFDCIKEFLS